MASNLTVTRGRLRVYLGYAPGAGATCALLREGYHQLADDDVPAALLAFAHAENANDQGIHGLARDAAVRAGRQQKGDAGVLTSPSGGFARAARSVRPAQFFTSDISGTRRSNGRSG